MEIDHVVLWVEDAAQALEFYVDVVGLEAVRAEEFRQGKAHFPSVRVAPHALLDLIPRALAPHARGLVGEQRPTAAGEPLNHLCLAMSPDELDALTERLTRRGVPLKHEDRLYGARGMAQRAFYFQDPSGNVLCLHQDT